jgi:hypothetical protein
MTTAERKALPEITFTKERETKRMVRFAEEASEPVIGTLYISKVALAKIGDPETLTVKISR